MSSRLVLADSSAWVSHLTGQGSAASAAIGELLRTHRVAVNEVIRLEVLTGARDEAQYAELDDALRGLHLLPMSGAVWGRAERLRFELRRRGHVIPVPDALIAACALLYDCEVLHVDKHFDLIARSTSLKIHHP
jgi:predicted nucleic acid-binding protein